MRRSERLKSLMCCAYVAVSMICKLSQCAMNLHYTNKQKKSSYRLKEDRYRVIDKDSISSGKRGRWPSQNVLVACWGCATEGGTTTNE